MDVRWIFAVGLFAVVSCADETNGLRPRAAFDFGCTAEKLSFTQLAGNSYGVEGCGHRATYVETTPGVWTINSSDGQLSPAIAK